MHIVSDKSMQRPGYVYEKAGTGFIGYPAHIKPKINWKHIDGPLLYTSDCGLHWLTLWERFQMFVGLTNINKLNRKHCRTAAALSRAVSSR